MQKSAVFQGVVAGLVAALAVVTATRMLTDDEAPAAADAPNPSSRAAPAVYSTPAPPPAALAAAGHAPAVDPRLMHAENLRTARDASMRLEARWTAASVDARAAETEQLLATAVRSPGVASARFQPDRYAARCRAEMCRIEARFDGGMDPSEWSTRLLLEAGSQLKSSTTVVLPGEAGKYDVVIYAFRPGSTPWH